MKEDFHKRSNNWIKYETYNIMLLISDNYGIRQLCIYQKDQPYNITYSCCTTFHLKQNNQTFRTAC